LIFIVFIASACGYPLSLFPLIYLSEFVKGERQGPWSNGNRVFKQWRKTLL